jgi:sphingosine kinase
VTERVLHAKEIGQTVDTKQYDAIVTVSGDGLMHELVNGLLDRDDWLDASLIPLGIIPAGLSIVILSLSC